MRSTSESIEALFARQQQMEDHALAMGGQRFRKRLEEAMSSGSEATVGAAKKLLVGGIDKVEEGFKALCNAKRTPRAHTALKWVRALGPDVAAYLSLKVVLDHIHGRVTVRKIANEVTELMLDELRFRRFKEKEPKLFEYAVSGFNTSSYAHKARSLDARIHHVAVDVSDLQLTPTERFLVGVKLLDVVIETTGLVRIDKSRGYENGKPMDHLEVVATEETLKWLDERNEALEHLFPVNLPMVCPPLPWAPGRRGGYRFGLRGKHRLVRSDSKMAREKVEAAAMPAVYSALNRIQETPWAINKRVVQVIEDIINQGGGLAGIPEMSDAPMPAKPADIDTNEVARKAWRKAAHAVHERNHCIRVRRAEVFRLLSIVNLVKEEQAVWFPHNLDFRGRVYPVVNHLHPQGDDLTKALLQFAEGKSLGRDGAAYLALHGAAALGKTKDGRKLSKMTLQERCDYIVEASTEICGVAADPLGNRWWAEADDPWQFLAFCFDWAGFCAYDQEGRGDDYVSCLPVGMDGTCNGLQHFAALWLDPVGAQAVNVSPSVRPQDIYQRIADVVLQRLEQDAAKEPLALRWLSSGIVDRKLTKRPTMTFGYGSAQFGFAQQLREHVESHQDWHGRLLAHFSDPVVNEETGETESKSVLHGACTYMAKLIWESLEVVAVSAFEGMAWMRSCAKVISKDGQKCVEWTVPGTGFPVTQTYYEEKIRRTDTLLAGSVFRPQIFEPGTTPAWKKQTSSVAPNVVHSLDAAALMATVNLCADNGIECFAMVHDSYGTLAHDAGLLASVTRQAFHGLYTQQDVVGSLWAQWQAQAGEMEIPAPPAKGDLDLSGVLVSEYFFS